MKPFRLMSLWLLVTVAMTSPVGAFEVCDPAAAGFDGEKLAMILPAMQRHIEEGKLITIYMVQINPTGQSDFGGEMKELVYASMQ